MSTGARDEELHTSVKLVALRSSYINFFQYISVQPNKKEGKSNLLSKFTSVNFPIRSNCCFCIRNLHITWWIPPSWPIIAKSGVSLLNQISRLGTISPLLEKIHLGFCNIVWKLTEKISNIACKAQLSRLPLIFDTNKRIFNNISYLYS